jgi:hypothetical protein
MSKKKKRSWLLTATVLASCGGTANSTSAEDIRAAMFPSTNASAVAELQVANRRTRDRLAACMKREGFDFEQSTVGLSGDFGGGIPEGTYGVSVKVIPVAPTKLPVGFGTPAYEKALKGSLAGSDATPESCLGKAVAELKGTLQLNPKRANQIRAKYERLYVNDDRVKELTKSWSPCMKGKGFQFSDPSGIEEGLLKEMSTATTPELLGALQSKERSIWKADQSCQQPFFEELKKIRTDFEKRAAAEY